MCAVKCRQLETLERRDLRSGPEVLPVPVVAGNLRTNPGLLRSFPSINKGSLFACESKWGHKREIFLGTERHTAQHNPIFHSM